MRRRKQLCAPYLRLWCSCFGLRGALPVAMALSLPRAVDGAAVPERELILVTTYVVVVFSVLVQGLTIGPLARRLAAASKRFQANN
jgi:CPA1 family monovalent cation:H+ antiporter